MESSSMDSDVQVMKKSEKIFIAVSLIFLLMLGSYVYWYRSKVDFDKTYLLARVTRVTGSGENAPVYFYYYKFKNKKYESKVGGYFRLYDSLMIIKVSKSNPEFCLYTDLAVPTCIRNEKLMDSSWDELPLCTNATYDRGKVRFK